MKKSKTDSKGHSGVQVTNVRNSSKSGGKSVAGPAPVLKRYRNRPAYNVQANVD